MKIYYVTLVQELQGYCIKAMAPSEGILRKHLHKYYGRLWCSVYKENPPEDVIGHTLYVEDNEDE